MYDKVDGLIIFIGSSTSAVVSAAVETHHDIGYDILIKFVLPVLAGLTVIVAGHFLKKLLKRKG